MTVAAVVGLILPAASLTCFVCQTPITLQFGRRDEVIIYYVDETTRSFLGRGLDEENSRRIFCRDGSIRRVLVSFGGLPG